MKFLIDAQLPKKLSIFLVEKGFDSIHSLDLPDKNRTKDSEINRISIEQARIVISKDANFYNGYFQKAEPFKLIFLTIDNCSTEELLKLFDKNFEKIFEEIDNNFVIEISKESIISIL